MIRKTSETRALAGNIVNAYSESQNSAYSSEYINGNLIDETSYTISGVSSRTTVQDYSCIVKGGICYFYVNLKTTASTNYDAQLLSGFPAPIKDNYPIVAQVTGSNTIAAVRIGQNGYAYGTSTFVSGLTILISGAYKVREN